MSEAMHFDLAPPSHRGLIAVAASLGGLRVIQGLMAGLPRELPVPVVVVQHLSDTQPSHFADLLASRSSLPTRWLAHREPLCPGVAYVAPAGRHVEVDAHGRAVLLDTPRINYSRPAADPLFTSAAAHYGAGTIVVVLTGRLFDGSAGAVAVRRAGGVVIAQEPSTCAAPGMPRAAIDAGAVHFVLPPTAIARALIAMTMMPGARAMFGLPNAA